MRKFSVLNYEFLPGTPAQDFGPPWYCCIRSEGVLICEVSSSVSLADAEEKAANLAHSLRIANVAEDMYEVLKEVYNDVFLYENNLLYTLVEKVLAKARGEVEG